VVGPRRLSGRPREASGRKPAARPAPRTVFSLSEEETFGLGRAIGGQLRGGELIALEGDLGLGKTVLARGIAAGLGIAPAEVSSPSFTLVQEYTGGRARVVHVDLYRLEGEQDLESIGIDEILASGAVVIVEWAERLLVPQRREAIVIRLHDVGEGSRRIEVLPSAMAPQRSRDDA
jgi:tRNA threonylcarbamoyladenosine biosynthesis protein TsaE